MSRNNPPLIAHIIYHLGVGGLENGLVNIINRIPGDQYHHAIICLQGYTDFRKRITNPHVKVYALDKKPGKDVGLYWRLWKLLRQLKPDIVHSRNIAALDSVAVSWLARVPARVHGEHGRDMFDLHGKNTRYIKMRQVLNPLFHHFIALSADLSHWLETEVGISSGKTTQIYNGVDSERFHPRQQSGGLPDDFTPPEGKFVFGTIGRFEEVKDQMTLLKAFHQLLQSSKQAKETAYLVMIGDGSQYQKLADYVSTHDLTECVWMPGARDDTPELYRCMDCFILPSLGEGISNTILEAMASGLPVVATAVGGNPELVDEQTGFLVPAADVDKMSAVMQRYLNNGEIADAQRKAAREKILGQFSMERMVEQYLAVYEHISE